MSRSDYIDPCDFSNDWEIHSYRGRVANAIKGKRSQEFFKKLLAALDAMSEKVLGEGSIKDKDSGLYCTLGVLAKDLVSNHATNTTVAEKLNIAKYLADEVTYMNDEFYEDSTPEERWVKMRQWVVSNIVGNKT